MDIEERTFANEQKTKLVQIVNEGVTVLTEIEDLTVSLNDTIKAIAEDLEIKPSILKKAIKLAQKSKWTDNCQDHQTLTDILETVGRTL
jgi:transposase-like protein